ncbi:hypothetical protein BUALT_Bualt05G0059200 [Buddleja alternifolia]|uniref:MBD domain-containing protein n=1 Tax=Buddleja alternifolia TaxID=168488 RepID=A0AAV6XIH0_9LAMI|nr:hypothetical protein BUALT_Bualt05G0059200 [Buddleja alternifolia]
MVAGKSPEWLPPGFTEKVKYKNGRKIKYYLNVATGVTYNSKKDVISSATTENVSNGTPQSTQVAQTTNDVDHGLSSNNKIDISAKTNDSLDGLPDGWTVEEKTRKNSSGKGSTYKVYIESSSGSKFYSRAAVARYLNSRDHAKTTTLQNKHDIVDEPLLDMPQTNAGPTPKKEHKKSSSKTVATPTSADGLPPGWIKEMKTCKSGDKTRKYPVYIDSSSGNKFSSKAAVTRYLNSLDQAITVPIQNKLDNVDEPLPDMSPQSMADAGLTPEKKKKESSSKKVATVSTSADGLPPGWIKETKISKSGNKKRKVQVYINTSSGTRLFSRVAVDRYVNSVDHVDTTPVQNKLDNVDEPLPDTSQQLPRTIASPPENKKKESSYKTVATVSTPADGLPPGWIKEIRTSQSGNKIRKEPYYTDPVSGYEFRSKPDALRYLKNGDIRYCVCKPKRKEVDDPNPKLTESEIPVIQQASPDLQELTSKCTYWQNQAQAIEERSKALEVQQTKLDDQLKKAREKEARLVATLEASLSREEQKSSQLEATQKELKATKAEHEEKSSQLETAQKEHKAIKVNHEEKSSQLETAQKELKALKMELKERSSQLKAAQMELEESRKEIVGLTAELSKEKEKVLELEKATCQMGGAPKGFDINRFDPFRVDGPPNAFTNPSSTSTTAAAPNPQEDEFASLFTHDDDRGQGQGQPRWPRFF